MSIAPNAHLQQDILLHLLEAHPEPVKVLADLARLLEASRSSVSRAVHALAEGGYVIKGDKGWVLTDSGIDEAERIELEESKGTSEASRIVVKGISPHQIEALRMKASELANVASQLVGSYQLNQRAFESLLPDEGVLDQLQLAVNSFAGFKDMTFAWDDLPPLIDPPVTENFAAAFLRNSSALNQWEGISAAVAPDLHRVSARLAQESLATFARSQHIGLSLMPKVAPLGEIASSALRELSGTNMGLSWIMKDLGHISALDSVHESIDRHFARLLPDVAELGRVYGEYVEDVAGRFGELLAERPFTVEIARPTWATAAYVGVVRDLVLVDDRHESHVDVIDFTREESSSGAGEFFLSFGQQYHAKWEGARLTLSSSNPDRISQAAHSGRELLMQLLEVLAPDDVFTQDEIDKEGHNGRVTRKMRVRKAAYNSRMSAVKLADTLAEAIDNLYGEITAVSHNRDSEQRVNEEQLDGLLYMMYGALKFIVGSGGSHRS